jgi:peptidoglycan/xylan/chitin deacetylase (PgdA/CDA1 family)
LAAGGGLRLLRHSRKAAIFMLHSVVDRPEDFLALPEYTSAAFLEDVLTYYRESGFEFVTLSEAINRLGHRDAPDKFIVFTLDDGYRDNLTIALPIFERFGCPFTVYVATGMVERTMLYWWGALREVGKRNDRIDYEPLGVRFPARSSNEKRVAYLRISRHMRRDAVDKALARQFMSRHGVSDAELLDREALDEEDVRRLSASPLVTIGGHTTTHQALTRMSIDEAHEEIVANRAFLENITQKPVEHFAYPYGDKESCGPREFALVEALGFKSGVTTQRGNLIRNGDYNRYSLPRALFSGSREVIAYIDAQRSGLWSRLEQAIRPSKGARKAQLSS